jgi:hypothetical protein
MVRQDLTSRTDGDADATEAERQVVAKTGKPSAHWARVLSRFGAGSKPTAAAVEHLQDGHGVPRAWARTLVTDYLQRHG